MGDSPHLLVHRAGAAAASRAGAFLFGLKNDIANNSHLRKAADGHLRGTNK